MNYALRICVYVLVVCVSFLTYATAIGKNNTNETASKDRFQWNEHARLTWDDFKGEVKAPHDESAAATNCGIGFKTSMPTAGGKPEIIVYNVFYTNKSWVRPDARIQSILDHEQGHFDLCEIYTRKLKERTNNFDLTAPGAKQKLMHIYAEVSSEYETRQQAYELETIHGTNLAEQRKWQGIIATELM